MAKTKALISFAVTVKLICAFVFAYAHCWFSHVAAHILKQGCTVVSMFLIFVPKHRLWNLILKHVLTINVLSKNKEKKNIIITDEIYHDFLTAKNCCIFVCQL